MWIKNAIFHPDKKKSKLERLGSWKFFCREFLKLEVIIFYLLNMQPAVFSDGLRKWKSGNYMSYCGLTSFRTISSETSSADATYAQES